MIFHINDISVTHNAMSIIAERLIDNLAGRAVPPFRVDHFGNREDGIFIIVSEEGETPLAMQKAKAEVKDAVVSVKNEFRLERFSGRWIS